ncbi:hypothetical protein [Chryseobacterium indologenes]|uniref:hypothetical protein n=1 Tax=Chryseobacterium indologenes TaxID=253 RepID=UPI0009A1A287|nr:hypothetical protein [Chryseobacterium indologenes]
MSTKQVNADSLMDILEEYNVRIDYETAEKASEDFQAHLSMMRDMESYSVASHYPRNEETNALKREIEELKKEIEIYKNSVKQRRNASHVWTENGRVYYDL